MTGILISVNGEKMDTVVSNMMAATCEGTIMDNIPIIMTLGTPTAPYLGCKKPLDRDATPAYSSLPSPHIVNIAHLGNDYIVERGSRIAIISFHMCCFGYYS